MAITKEIVQDKIEIVGEFKKIHVRTATVIKEDGVELSRSFHRHVVNPNSDSNNKNVYEWEPFILATQKTMYFHQVEDGERGVPIDHKKVCEMLYDWKRVYRYGPHIQLLENILAK